MSDAPKMLSPSAVTAELLAVAPKATGGPFVETAQPPAPAQSEVETAPAAEAPRDSLGRPFDPKRFRTKPDGTPFLDKNGRFMPRGGRKPKTPENRETTAQEPPAAAPSGPAWTEAERASASQPPPPPNGEADPAAKTVEPEVVGSAEDSAEVACRAVYTALGFATGAPEEAIPTPAEHKNMQAMTAAYFRARGWVFAGGVAVCVALLAYLLRTVNRPKTHAKVRSWFSRGGEGVTDKGEPAPAASPPAPEPKSAPAAAHNNPLIGSVSESSGLGERY